VRVWRICREAHVGLDGEGARLFGGRWNNEGAAVVYASSTLALAALEYLAHVDIADAPADLVAVAIDVPDDAEVWGVPADDLPADWTGPDRPECAAIGDGWAAARDTVVLLVPSAIVPEDSNVLLNPSHPRAPGLRDVATRPFAFDPRLPMARRPAP
jgi:RES domain-containing protein